MIKDLNPNSISVTYSNGMRIKYYNKRRFKAYELGEIYTHSMSGFQPSEKEISISEFKGRYGGCLSFRILWQKNRQT